MIDLVLKRENRLRKSDGALFEMCDQLLAEFLPEFNERPISVTWRVMRERWGSCTTVDKSIRISERLNNAPDYALRYVLFHELIHLRIAGHGDDFQEVADVVVLWWREDDGDLVDALVDAISGIAAGGVVWVLTPKAGRDGHVEPSDIGEAASTAG